ncbi:MAG: peptidoglycan-binding domain-containing protein [Candidatus Sericytochromatia bacterium]
MINALNNNYSKDQYQNRIIDSQLLPPIQLVQNNTLGQDFTAISNLLKNSSSNLPLINFDSYKGNIVNSLDEIRNGLVVKKGDSGKAIEEIQSLLTKNGFKVNIDGVFGDETQKAIESFQKKNSIELTLAVGPTTLEFLEKKSPLQNSNNVSEKLAKVAENIANQRNTTGRCYSAVADAIESVVPITLWGNSAYMASEQLASSDKFREIKVSNSELKSLPAGAVVIWGQTDSSPHGHISVALGDGREASDYVDVQRNNLRGYTNARVFLPVA